MKKCTSIASIALFTSLASTSALAGDIQVSGKVFYDYSNQETTTAAGTDKKIGSNITRSYLTAKKKIDDTWSAKLTVDSALNSAHDGKKSEVFLKKAQLTGRFSDTLNVKFGMISTPWVGYGDKLGKHRHVSKSFVDTHKMDASADAGMGLFGTAMDGMISYDIVSVNGGGYGNVTTSEKQDLNLRIGVRPVEGLTIDLGYLDGYKGKFVAGTAEKNVTLNQFMVTYGQQIDNLSYRVAINSITYKIVDQLATTNAATTQKGQELWAWVRSGEFGGYVRSESFDNGVAGDATEKRTVLGIDYYAAKGLILSLVSDSVTDAKGVAGDDTSKAGIFTQFKF